MKLPLFACGLIVLLPLSIKAQTSVGEIADSTLLSGNIQTPIQMINGLVPGMLVSKSNTTDLSGYEIRVRGFNTLNGRANPLIVLDGLIIPSYDFVDPNDIQSIKVLRGAETAKYGMQGASGVIEITTKGFSKDFQINYHGFANVDTKIYRQQVLNADSYLAAGGRDLGAKTDWVDETTRPAFTHAHGVTFSQGFKALNYRASVNYRGVQGIQQETGYDRINGSLNLSLNVSKFLKVQYNGAFNSQTGDPGFVQVTRFAQTAPPTMPVYFESGDYYQYIYYDSFNPKAIIGLSTNELVKTNLQNQLKLSSNIGKLQVNAFVGQSYSDFMLEERFDEESYYRGEYNDYYDESREYRLTQVGGDLSMTLESGNWWIQPTLAFDNQIYSQDFSTTRTVLNLEGKQLRTDSDNDDVILMGGSLQADMGVADKWNLSVGNRLEASSALSADNRLQHFPWVNSRLNVTKLLGFGGSNFFIFSHGKSGLTPYREGLSARIDGPEGFVDQLPNSSLQNEVVKNTDIGFDWRSKNQRLGVDVKWYWKVATEMIGLHNYRSPREPEYASPMNSNFGKLANQGLELTLSYQQDINERIKWSSNLVMTTFASKWKSLEGDNDINLDSTYYGYVFNLTSIPVLNYYKQGEPFGSITAVKVNGPDGQGSWNFLDQNGNGAFDYFYGDQQIVGQAIPKLTFGWNNEFSMDRYRLSFLITGAVGHQLVNESAIMQQPNALSFNTYNLLKSYREIEQVRDRYIVDYFVQDASFVRLSNIEFSYQVKSDPTSKLSNVQVYLVANNLLTVSSYPGNSPDYNLASTSFGINDGRTQPVENTVSGIDRANSMYTYRSFTIGIRASLF